MEHCFAYDTAIAETKSGRVRGYEYNGITIFKGIPYTKAGRFHAPEPMERQDAELVPVTQERGVTEKLEAQIFNSVIAFARTGSQTMRAYLTGWQVRRRNHFFRKIV